MQPASQQFGAAQHQLQPAEPVTLDTLYKDIGAVPSAGHYKSEIDRTQTEFKLPMRTKLQEISALKGTMFQTMADELGKIQLSLIKMENKQIALLNDTKPLLEEIKTTVKDIRFHGMNGLQQIRTRCSGLSSANNNVIVPLLLLDEDLPNSYYLSLAERLESRLTNCIQEIRYFSVQVNARITALNNSKSMNKDQYGQTVRIGAKQVLELIKFQNESFLSITALVAVVHREVAEVKEVFLRQLSKRKTGDGAPAG